MIVYVQPHDRGRYLRELEQYAKIRKSVFCDRYGWVTPNPDGTESDHLDAAYNLIILYVETESSSVKGGVRLVPTTGPTLMHSVWSDMLPHKDDFRSPNIWEATRFCVDQASNSSRNQNFVNRVSMALSVALFDFASANGISHIIGVCERHFFDLSGAFGAHAEIISSKHDQNGIEICCGLWSSDEATRKSLGWARAFVGGTEPVQIRAA